MKVLAHIQAFLKDEEGASGIEYAMIAGMAALALTAFAEPIKTAIDGIMGKASEALGKLNK